jgi:hypothetical protein
MQASGIKEFASHAIDADIQGLPMDSPRMNLLFRPESLAQLLFGQPEIMPKDIKRGRPFPGIDVVFA